MKRTHYIKSSWLIPLCLAATIGCSDSSSGECGPFETEGATGCECIANYTRHEGKCIATNLTMPPEELPQQTGVDQACAAPTDCDGMDADFCESFVSFSCLVSECDPNDPRACSVGHHCCEFPDLGLPNLCVSAELSQGVCN